MSTIILLNQKELYTLKAKGLKSLAEKNVLIPYTIIFQEDQNITNLSEEFGKLNSEYCYTRLNFSDNEYPHHLSETIRTDLLTEKLNSLKLKAESLKKTKYDIIVQPIINFEFSGVALVLREYVLIEIVFGHIISLLRLGEFKFRFLFDKNMNLIDLNEGEQTVSLMWQEDKLISTSRIIKNTSFHNIMNTIKELRTNEHSIYEFGVTNSKLIYLESKPVNSASYPSLALNALITPFIVYQNIMPQERIIQLAKPTMDDVSLITNENSFIVNKGAYLSHFATYCAQNNICCQFLG